MQRRTHAAIGAITLTTPRHVRTWSDAYRSIELVGASTPSGGASGGVQDPIEAARLWLADPMRRQVLGIDLVSRAESSIGLAESHLRELDLIAAALASDIEMTGRADGARLAHAEQMASVLDEYSSCMRSLLDPDDPDPTARERLDRALSAASRGGLTAFVAAL